MVQNLQLDEQGRDHLPDRQEAVNATIKAFVDLVLIQKFVDMPRWLEYDLTVSQVRAIYFLATYGQLTVSGLAGFLEMGKPAASILVQQLVEQELVERFEDTVDRRRTWVRLTGLGGKLVNGRREQRELKFQGWLGEMDDEDLSCLRQGVTALLELVRRDQQRIQAPRSD